MRAYRQKVISSAGGLRGSVLLRFSWLRDRRIAEKTIIELGINVIQGGKRFGYRRKSPPLCRGPAGFTAALSGYRAMLAVNSVGRHPPGARYSPARVPDDWPICTSFTGTAT